MFLIKLKRTNGFLSLKKTEVTIQDQLCSGRPLVVQTKGNIGKIRSLISEYRRKTIVQLEDLSWLSLISTQRILNVNLEILKVATKFVTFGLNETTTLIRAPYSPDLVLSNFFVLPRMKRDLKGKLFPGSTT